MIFHGISLKVLHKVNKLFIEGKTEFPVVITSCVIFPAGIVCFPLESFCCLHLIFLRVISEWILVRFTKTSKQTKRQSSLSHSENKFCIGIGNVLTFLFFERLLTF